MRREAPRTLYSLSDRYQREVDGRLYEVIVIENPSDQMLGAAAVEGLGPSFRYIAACGGSLSPVSAVNLGVHCSRGKYVAVMIDGARIVSPGILRYSLMALRLHPDPIVATLAWHLGPKNQAQSVKEGYNAQQEDQLLSAAGWKDDGYRLFSIASLGGSSASGWFAPIAESNFITLSRRRFESLGGYSTEFTSPAGGLVNLDFYRRAVTSSDTQLIVLLGEGTFHQVHGGIATNRTDDAVLSEFFSEYERIRCRPYQVPTPASEPIYLGTMPRQAVRFSGDPAMHRTGSQVEALTSAAA
jgi:hypothetical protein